MLGIGIGTARDRPGTEASRSRSRKGPTKGVPCARRSPWPRASRGGLEPRWRLGYRPEPSLRRRPPQLIPSRRSGISRHLLAFVAAAITVVGIVTAVGTRPASAAGTDEICLTNSDAHCFWSEVLDGTIAIAIYDLASRVVIWIPDKVGKDPEGDQEDEEKTPLPACASPIPAFRSAPRPQRRHAAPTGRCGSGSPIGKTNK
jgi:hypothetical protein